MSFKASRSGQNAVTHQSSAKMLLQKSLAEVRLLFIS
jgi:hypothetical protein